MKRKGKEGEGRKDGEGRDKEKFSKSKEARPFILSNCLLKKNA